MEERLQKIIARAGFASRRRAEEMMASGLVTVNGRTVTELGTKADLSRDHIKVAGKLIRGEPGKVYIALNKPDEVVATMSDPEGRKSIRDFLQGITERVFPTGRMEYRSSGLIILTNDGDFANRVLQSRTLRQTWHVKLKTLLTFEQIESLSRATGARITRIKGKNAPWYEINILESRRDPLRDRLFRAGNMVEKMKRVAVGNVQLGAVSPGEHRELSAGEVAAFEAVLRGDKVAPVGEAAARPRRRVLPRSKKK